MAGYRRGLIGPYYTQGRGGMQSRVREELVLDMLAMEQAGESRGRSASMHASLLGSHYSSAKIGSVLDMYDAEVRAVNALCAYDPSQAASREQRLANSTQKLLELYRQLLATGKDKEILKELTKNNQPEK